MLLAQAEFDRLSEGFDSSKAILSALGQKNGGREAFTCISQIEQNGQHFAMGNQNLEEFHLKLAELVTKVEIKFFLL
jgi:hypothetical protein